MSRRWTACGRDISPGSRNGLTDACRGRAKPPPTPTTWCRRRSYGLSPTLKTLQPRGDTGVLSYFKTIIMNLVREYIRRGRRRPTSQLDDSDAEEPIEPTPSALEELLGAEVLDRYQRALLSLGEDDQDLILAAVELRLHDAEIAELFEKPSVNAARMARARALGRLARAMEADVHGPRDAV